METFKEGELVMFRRIFKDPFPRMGKILKVGFQAVAVETAEGIQLFVPVSNIWHRR